MERPIAYDRLAREDRFVRMRVRRLAEIDERFSLGGMRREGAADQVPIAISTEYRRLAGFTDEDSSGYPDDPAQPGVLRRIG